MDKLLSGRSAAIRPFHAMDILAKAQHLQAQGKKVIHLEVGEPDFPTPSAIIQAGHRALDQGKTRYTSALGLSVLREQIGQYYADQYGVSIDANRIIISNGASGALFLALAALVNPGDRIAITDPGYPCNGNFVTLFGGTNVFIPLDADNAYEVTVELIKRHWQKGIKALLLASPANPTGRIIDNRELRLINDFVKSQNAILLMDEIYLGLVYGEQPAGVIDTALKLDDEIVVINSFSKYFCMTGWRLGWLVVPERWVSVIDRIAQNVFLAPSSPAQYAALAAFEPETLAQLENNRRTLEQRRDYLYPALKRLGFVMHRKPEGAFYIYADCSALHSDSRVFANALLEQTGVAITPGIDFGQREAESHVRFSYTVNQGMLEQAVADISGFLSLSG